MAQSNDLDPNLAAEVLFESDRTCCICRDPTRPVQIHHLDGDHSNNDRANLVVACESCHTWSHTTIPFNRSLTPELVREYDKSWRTICAARLLPGVSDREVSEYREEVFLEIALVCHAWRATYAALYPGKFQASTGDYEDVWDLMIETADHPLSEEEWNKYRPLFDKMIDTVTADLETIVARHGDVIPAPLKTQIIRTNRQLRTEQVAYLTFGPTGTSVKSRARGVLRSLANLARVAAAGTSVSPVVQLEE